MRRSIIALMAACIFTVGGMALATDTVAYWDRDNGNWSNAADWSTAPYYPDDDTPSGVLYDAAMDSGQITLDISPTIENFNMYGGTLLGSGTLTTRRLFTWEGGTLKANLNPKGGISFTGQVGILYLNGTTLTIPGASTATFGSASDPEFELQDSATFTNGGTLTASNGYMLATDGTSNLFNNSGTFNVDLVDPNGTFPIYELPFNNSGTTNIQSGLLQLIGGDTGATKGKFTVNSGATLEFSSNFTLEGPETGAGTVLFDSDSTSTITSQYQIGVTTISNAQVYFNQSTSEASDLGALTMEGPATLGGTANLLAHGLTWSGGTLAANLTSDGINIKLSNPTDGSSGPILDGATLINAANQSATITGPDYCYLAMQNGATFTNLGTLTATTGNLEYDGGNVSNFSTAGTFTVNLSDTTSTFGIAVQFHNSGVVNVRAGTFQINNNWTNTGTIDIAGGTAVLDQAALAQAGTILGMLHSGYANGAWDGTGITSSLAAVTPGTAVGYSVSGSKYTLRWTWLGDTDLNGVVDSADMLNMAPIGTTGATWNQGDFNYDGVVNADDWALLTLGAAEQTGNFPAVPEPDCIGLMSVVTLEIISRRRTP